MADVKYTVDTSDLDKLNLKYDGLIRKMLLFEDAGKKNTSAYRLMSVEAKNLEKQMNSLAGSYTNAEKTQSLFRNRNLNLGADLTVLSMGVKSVIGDISDLANASDKGSLSFGTLASSAGSATLSLLAMSPAIKALSSIGLAGFGILVTGITAVGSAIFLLIGNIASLGQNLGMIGNVLKGQLSIWDAVEQSIKNATFGLIDFTDELDSINVDNAVNELERLRFMADFVAESLRSSKQNALDASELLLDKARREGFVYVEPMTDEKLRQQTAELKSANKQKKGRSPSVKQVKEEESAILKLIGAMSKEIQLLELRKTIDSDYLKQKIEELTLLDKETLKIEEQIGLLEQIATLRDKLDKSMTGKSAPSTNAMEREAGVSSTSTPSEDTSISMREEFDAMYSITTGIVGDFAGMLQFTGLMKGEFGQIINMIQGLLSSVNSGFNLFSTLLSFVPGGSAIAGVASSATMPSGFTMPSQPRPVFVFKNLLSGQKFLMDEMDEFNYNQSRLSLS
jgi:hypothetical protein